MPENISHKNLEAIDWSKSDIYEAAEQAVEYFNIKPGSPLTPFVKKLNGNVKRVNFWELQDSNDGSIEIEPDKTFTIYIPDFVQKSRARFTVAHELGHFFLHYWLKDLHETAQAYRAARYTDGKTDRTEWEANWFAAAFLMPRKIFKKKFEEKNGQIIELAKYFGVSETAASLHAKYLNLTL